MWWVQMTNGSVCLRETGALMDLIVALQHRYEPRGGEKEEEEEEETPSSENNEEIEDGIHPDTISDHYIITFP